MANVFQNLIVDPIRYASAMQRSAALGGIATPAGREIAGQAPSRLVPDAIKRAVQGDELAELAKLTAALGPDNPIVQKRLLAFRERNFGNWMAPMNVPAEPPPTEEQKLQRELLKSHADYYRSGGARGNQQLFAYDPASNTYQPYSGSGALSPGAVPVKPTTGPRNYTPEEIENLKAALGLKIAQKGNLESKTNVQNTLLPGQVSLQGAQANSLNAGAEQKRRISKTEWIGTRLNSLAELIDAGEASPEDVQEYNDLKQQWAPKFDTFYNEDAKTTRYVPPGNQAAVDALGPGWKKQTGGNTSIQVGGRTLPTGPIQDLAKLQSLEKSVEDLANEGEKYVGPRHYLTKGIRQQIPGTMSEEEASWRSRVMALIRYAYSLTGKTLNPSEQKLYEDMLPKGWEGNTAAYRGKMNALWSLVHQENGITEELLKQAGYKVPGVATTPTQTQAQPQNDTNDLSSLSDEELQKIVNGG